jgi:uncharacterized coiled-coil protein SlyX
MSAPASPGTEPDLADRLTDAEVRLAYQDRTIAALDEVVRELADRVARLERELERLTMASTGLTGAAGAALEE